MFINVALFATYLALMFAAGWLFTHRNDYQRWFHLLYGFVFACLMIGLFPAYPAMTLVGYLLLLVCAGLQVATNFLMEILDKKELDIERGEDRKAGRLIAQL